MYELLPRTNDGVVGIRVSDKLTADDYQALRPHLFQRVGQHGPLRVLFLMEDWHGWKGVTGLWEDLKTDVRLNDYVERLAMVGDEDWERWMTDLAKPFAEGTIRYFDRDELEEAWTWLEA